MAVRSAEHSIDSIVNSLRRITQAIRLSASEVQDKLGISSAQLFVLQQLAEHPASSLRELQERTFTDQSSVSVVVSRLVGHGHVARKRSKVDARRLELETTATGRALVRRAPPLPQAKLVSALHRVAATDLDIAAKVMERVALDVAAGKPQMFFESPPVVAAKRGRR